MTYMDGHAGYTKKTAITYGQLGGYLWDPNVSGNKNYNAPVWPNVAGGWTGFAIDL